MTDKTYEYDVAFSFHSKDESLATQLNDLLQDRFKTFLYSRQQEVLVSTDGEQKFNTVFGEQARCVVVFCRKEWGETPFTRIEQTAIRNRAFAEGYDFTIFIPTDDPPAVPKWLPRTRLYLGLARFGLPSAAGVVEKRIQELGGEPTVESITDRAARLNRAHELAEAKKRFRKNFDGVRHAEVAFGRLVSALQTKIAELAALQGRLTRLSIKRQGDYWVVTGLRLCLLVDWHRRFGNVLDESVLSARIFDGMPRIPGVLTFDKAEPVNVSEYDYELLVHDQHGYVERTRDKRSFSAEDLADHILRVYMETAEKYEALEAGSA